MFAFVKGEECFGSSSVLPKLVSAQTELGDNKIRLVLIPLEESFLQQLCHISEGDVHMVTYGHHSDDMLDKFKLMLPEISSPQIVVVETQGGSHHGPRVLAENAAKCIFMHGTKVLPSPLYIKHFDVFLYHGYYQMIYFGKAAYSQIFNLVEFLEQVSLLGSACSQYSRYFLSIFMQD